MIHSIKDDKLENYCKYINEKGLSYAEAQRLEWIEKEKQKKRMLELAKQKELRKRGKDV